MRYRSFILTIAAAIVLGMLPAGAVPVPVVASDNIELLMAMPDVTAISTAFSTTSPTMYVNTLTGVSTFDISDPKLPKPLGHLPMPHFENEAMALGERADGTKFVLIGNDVYSASPTAPGDKYDASGNHVIVVDVTNPASPTIRGQVDTPTSTHTVQCLSKDCTFAYTSGAYDAGKFDLIDLTNLDQPKVTKTITGLVSAMPGGSHNGNHQWDFDDSGIVWGSGGTGVAGLDITDPANPKTVASTDAQATASPYNNFILHNSYRPGAKAFTQVRDEATGRLNSGSKETASPFDGNVLLVTEEDYDNPVCGGGAGEGTFSTWHIPYADAAQYKTDNPLNKVKMGKITPLDNWNTEILNSGQPTVAGGLCSAHYFTYHDSGFVAQGWYQQGTRILDVRNPRDIKQVGYFFTGATETWHAYWVPQYVNGVQTGKETNIVYTNDAARGIDVLQVGLPTTPPADTEPLRAPILPQWLTAVSAPVGSLPSKGWGYLCRIAGTL